MLYVNTNDLLNQYVVFQYGNSPEWRSGIVEKVHTSGVIVLRDDCRNNNYRSFTLSKINSSTLRLVKK
jgi:hypothetical protein